MLIRARAPLRLGLGGGGTDLSPYCDTFGGAVLNATINLYAYATLEPLPGGDRVVFAASDTGASVDLDADAAAMDLLDPLILHRAVYRHVVMNFREGRPFPCRLNT